MATARQTASLATRQCYRHHFWHRTTRPTVILAVVLGLIGVLQVDGSGSIAAATTRPPNSADRIIFWTGCPTVVDMSNADLARWHRRGVDAFTCGIGRLDGLGGQNRYTGDTGALTGKPYAFERSIRDSNIVARARRYGMKLYLGFYLANVFNAQTPLAEWFDDAAWAKDVLPQIKGVAAAAHALGFEGLTFDQELYPQQDNRATATWAWDYDGNTHTEEAVRQQVQARGREVMQTILASFPKVKILAYGSAFPDSWDELVQQEINGTDSAYRDYVFIDFWDGLTSVDGYESIQFLNAIFYKTAHISGASWDNAYAYEYNRFFAMLSTRLSNWVGAADRISESPFVWISSGSTDFEAARDPAYVTEQLAAARRWGMERSFANYTFDNLTTFDYGPYLAGLRAASKSGVVDDEPPRLAVDGQEAPPAVASTSISLTGTAMDNQAIRVVRWKTDDGHAGAAAMEWDSRGDPRSGWNWQMIWKAERVPLHSGVNTIEVSAEDIKGLFAVQTVTITV